MSLQEALKENNDLKQENAHLKSDVKSSLIDHLNPILIDHP